MICCGHVIIIRLVLMGNEWCLRIVREKTMELTNNAGLVELVGLDMEEEREEAFDEAVDKAWKLLGHLDALVNCYAYEGNIYVLGSALNIVLDLIYCIFQFN